MSKQIDKHTVIWVPRFWPAVGGTEFHSHELARNLAHKHRVTVLTHCTETESAQQPLARLAALANSTVTEFGSLRIVKLSATQNYTRSLALLGQYELAGVRRRAYRYCFDKAFRSHASDRVADAKRIHFIYNGLTSAASLASDLASAYAIPFVFTPNVLDTSNTSAWASRSFRDLYDRASQLIALTEHEADWLVQHGAHEKRITVVPYGPILQPRSTQDESDAAFYELMQSDFILFLGRLVPEKGYPILLEAFEKISNSDLQTQLVLVGPADESVSRLISELNAKFGKTRIHLLQNVTQPQKTALLEEAVMLCLPSSKESLGGVYIEAMACATPVVALDRAVSRCVIDHQQDGLLVDNNLNSLSSAIRRLLDNPAEVEKLGLAGRIKVSKRYAWPVVVRGIEAAYKLADEVFSDSSDRAA